jgi:hypothetical protein
MVMKTIPVSIAIQSHLSDAMIEMSFNPQLAQQRLQFVKYLVHHFDNTMERVDIEQQWDNFINNK